MNYLLTKKTVFYFILVGVSTSVIATIENESQESVLYLLWFLVQTYYSEVINITASIVSLFSGITAAIILRCCISTCKKQINACKSRKTSVENKHQNFDQTHFDLFDSEATKKFLTQHDC